MSLAVAARPVSVSKSASTSMLGLGSRGAEVLKLQRALLAAGFNPHGLDGSFGPKTQAAVLAFQRSAGIVVDGKVGPQTWGALNARTGNVSTVPASATTRAGIPQMLSWANSMIGSKYAAVNPFRFGNVPWDGKPHTSVNGSGTTYNFPKGTRVFDCSGFVVAAYRQLGVDLAAKGLASSWAFDANSNGYLQNVSRAQLSPGDLIVYQPHNGVGHVVIYQGNGKTIEARGGVGVTVRDVDWARVKSYRRVPLY